jgi:branched-chain amino acid transport system substrate-binding protein
VAGLRAALVTPLTGPLAAYGQAGALALGLWADRAQAHLSVHDAHPDLAAAMHGAGHPDIVFGPYGSGPARAFAAAAQRLWWNHGGAYVPSGLHVDVLAPATAYWEGALLAIRDADPHISTVAVVHGAGRFAAAVATGAEAAARALGLEVSRARLPVVDRPDAEVILVAGDFEEERAAAANLLPGRWRVAGFVGAGVDDVLADLGARRDGLLGPAQWLLAAAPRPDEGPSAAEFVAAYGSHPPYPAAQAFAAGLLAARCIRDAAGTVDADVRAAARELDCTTMFGRFRLDADTGEQVGHRPVTVQWQGGHRRVVWPPQVAEAAIRIG